MKSYVLRPVGFIRLTIKRREEAPRQGAEGAPDAWLEIEPQFADALLGMEVGVGERPGALQVEAVCIFQARTDAVLQQHVEGPLRLRPRRLVSEKQRSERRDVTEVRSR